MWRGLLLIWISGSLFGFLLSALYLNRYFTPDQITELELVCAKNGGVKSYVVDYDGVTAKCNNGLITPNYGPMTVSGIGPDDIDYELCRGSIVRTRYDDDDRLAEPDGWSLYETQPHDTPD